jgi:hypothetical protein
MKTLTSVAAYGLVPIPIRCELCEDNNDQLRDDDANAALLAWYRHVAAERMATTDEIARIYEEVADLEGPCRRERQSN